MATFEKAYELITQRRFSAAVREARNVASSLSPSWKARFGFAATLIDAGAQGKQRPWVVEGIDLLKAILPEVPSALAFHVYYNLGNGYLADAQFQRGSSLSTQKAQSLALAVNSLSLAVEIDSGHYEARINLANTLTKQGRYIEALDLLTEVIADAPGHPMPRLGRASALEHVYAWMQPHAGIMESALRDAIAAQERARAFPEYTRACESEVTRLKKLVKQSKPDGETVEAPPPLAWIWKNGLAMNLCPHCRDTSPTAFDVVVVNGLLDHLGRRLRRPSADDVSDIVGAWHRTFSAARWVVMGALEVEHSLPSDHVVFLRGSARAPDLKIGLLLQAAVGFHAVFDQIAFGLNSYLGLGHSPTRVDFNTVWYPPSKRQKEKGALIPSNLHPRLRRRALPPLSALYWLSRSLQDDGGLYRRLRELRNQAEHHVTVTTTSTNATRSKHFTAVDGERLPSDVLALGRLAKASIWYAGATISRLEKMRARHVLSRGAIIMHSTHNVERA
jgi:tetratricopeptide (TPR) repeat protein